MFRTFFAWIQKYERHLSAVAMLGGFAADNALFGRIDLWQTQAVFAAYALTCFVSIPLLHFIEGRAARGIERPRWRALLPIATQFALGGFWSGFFVFYTRSAAIAASWPFLLLIVVILVGNEVLRRYHERLVLTSVLFFFALYSYAILVVPVYTKTIGTLTFLGSGLVAIALFGLFTMLMRLVARERFLAEVWRIRIGALLVLAVVNVSYLANVLPPLPLSAEAAGIYHSVWRVPGNYLANEEKQPWQVKYLGLTPTLHVVPGESLYAYSAIFAPTALTTSIVHRWQWYDPTQKAWVTKAAISYPIQGGRDGGYRGYSAVLATLPGDWRVNIETPDGRLITRLSFAVVSAELPSELHQITLK